MEEEGGWGVFVDRAGKMQMMMRSAERERERGAFQAQVQLEREESGGRNFRYDGDHGAKHMDSIKRNMN